MRYQFIQTEKAHYPVTLLCQVLQVSRSGYYDWQGRSPSRHVLEDQRLLVKIRAIHKASRETYGLPRVHIDLQADGETCGKHRSARIMRDNDIKAMTQRKFKATTNSKHNYPVAENILDRQFTATVPNQRWVSDITYIDTTEGWLYLAVVLDLYSRAIVGWAMDRRMTRQLVADALIMALRRRGKVTGLLLHFDRGSQYASDDYQKLLKSNDITCSMSRKGNCYDNAAMESFFGPLKQELVHHEHYATREQAKASIFEYIEVFYNQQRRHSAINYLAPMVFEQQRALAKPVSVKTGEDHLILLV